MNIQSNAAGIATVAATILGLFMFLWSIKSDIADNRLANADAMLQLSESLRGDIAQLSERIAKVEIIGNWLMQNRTTEGKQPSLNENPNKPESCEPDSGSGKKG